MGIQISYINNFLKFNNFLKIADYLNSFIKIEMINIKSNWFNVLKFIKCDNFLFEITKYIFKDHTFNFWLSLYFSYYCHFASIFLFIFFAFINSLYPISYPLFKLFLIHIFPCSSLVQLGPLCNIFCQCWFSGIKISNGFCLLDVDNSFLFLEGFGWKKK